MRSLDEDYAAANSGLQSCLLDAGEDRSKQAACWTQFEARTIEALATEGRRIVPGISSMDRPPRYRGGVETLRVSNAPLYDIIRATPTPRCRP